MLCRQGRQPFVTRLYGRTMRYASVATNDEVSAVIRRAFARASATANEVPLAALTAAMKTTVSASSKLSATASGELAMHGVLHHASAIRRVLRLDPANDTAALDTNAVGKHYRNFLRALARVPDVGVARQTLRDWLPSMTEGEFDAAIKVNFVAWLRHHPSSDTIVPVLPHGTAADPVACAVMRALMAAPDAGLSIEAIRSAVVTATNTSPTADSIRQLLPFYWHVLTGPETVAFCDWVSVLTRVQQRLPAEGVTLANVIRYVQTEQHWPTNVVLADVVTAEFLRTHFRDLFVVRTAATDGQTCVVVPRGAMDVERGVASTFLKFLLADPTDYGAPRLPLMHGWRDTEHAIEAIEQLGLKPEDGGARSWVEFVREHPHLESQIVVSVRTRPERCRAAVFVAVAESGMTAAAADSLLRQSGLLAHSDTIEAQRVALRSTSQPAHGANDIVSPPWLETEFVLAAQLTDLAQRVAAGSCLPVDHVVVLCGSAHCEQLKSVIQDAGSSFKRLTVLTPDGAHPVVTVE